MSTPAVAESAAAQSRTHRRRVLLLGNPNTGKTSLFNALTGFRRHVAHYPGVTVEAARGPLRGVRGQVEIVDLPGTYSLAAAAPDESIACDIAAGRIPGEPRPDAVVVVADAGNLYRNLYLFSQVLELGLPTVLALNMVDLAAARGVTVDAALLAQRLGVPVVPVVATRADTVRPLAAAIEAALAHPPPSAFVALPEALATEAAALMQARGISRAEALRLLLEVDRPGGGPPSRRTGTQVSESLAAARGRLAQAGVDPSTELRARYVWSAQVLDGVVRREVVERSPLSDRLGHWLSGGVPGVVVLLLVLFALFQSVFTLALPVMELIEAGFASLGAWVAGVMPAGVWRSLVVNGVIAGVGGVLVFLPQILILFAFIAVLEDCGYMARAAFMMDRLMRVVGLSGRAFIPLLSAHACAVPAIMGTRTIADRRERIVTIMLAPFMSCSARLPVYVLLTAAFVPPERYALGLVGLQGLVMLGMYLVGIAVAVPVAWLLRTTALRGPPAAFMLELPALKRPRVRAVWQRMAFAGRSFLVRAGTIILAVSILVWAAGYFPRSPQTAARVATAAVEQGWDEEALESELAGAYLRESYLGRAGLLIEPALRPLEWDWRIGVAVLASFPAREVVVATLGIIYNLGEEQDETSEPLREALRGATWSDGRPVFSLPVAISLMVFFALCAQCASTLVMIARETGAWGWAGLSFAGMTLLAYGGAWVALVVTRWLT